MRIRQLTSLIMAVAFIYAGCGGGGGGGSSATGGSASLAGGGSSSAYGNSVTFAWDPPTENTDGTPLTDLAGYKIYYGNSSGSYPNSVDVGDVTTATIDNLSSGFWCFVSTAYNASGNESAFSEEVCTSI